MPPPVPPALLHGAERGCCRPAPSRPPPSSRTTSMTTATAPSPRPSASRSHPPAPSPRPPTPRTPTATVAPPSSPSPPPKARRRSRRRAQRVGGVRRPRDTRGGYYVLIATQTACARRAARQSPCFLCPPPRCRARRQNASGVGRARGPRHHAARRRRPVGGTQPAPHASAGADGDPARAVGAADAEACGLEATATAWEPLVRRRAGCSSGSRRRHATGVAL